MRSTKAFKAHDELSCNVGDKVIIVETAPFSATVTWAVEEIVKVEIRQEGVESVQEMIEETISVLEADEEVEAEEVEAEEVETEEVEAEEVETEEVETVEEVTEEAAEEVEEEVAEVVEDEEEEAA